jgi:hypothetical protein
MKKTIQGSIIFLLAIVFANDALAMRRSKSLKGNDDETLNRGLAAEPRAPLEPPLPSITSKACTPKNCLTIGFVNTFDAQAVKSINEQAQISDTQPILTDYLDFSWLYKEMANGETWNTKTDLLIDLFRRTTFKNLSFVYCNIPGATLDCAINLCMCRTELLGLTITDIPLHYSTIMGLSSLLFFNDSLTHLNLRATGLNQRALSHLTDALTERANLWKFKDPMTKQSPLSELDLSANALKDNAAESLADVLRTNPNLKKLDLSENNINQKGARALIEAAGFLEGLDLQGNPMIGSDWNPKELAQNLNTRLREAISKGRSPHVKLTIAFPSKAVSNIYREHLLNERNLEIFPYLKLIKLCYTEDPAPPASSSSSNAANDPLSPTHA